MNGKKAKVIRKHCNTFELPKGVYRKLKKTINFYNLTISQSLFLIDRTATMFYNKMAEVTKQMEEIENEQS